MDLAGPDLRLLRVFKAVADAGGFANAQTVLDLNPSTISLQMSQLESQLGYTLCQRGRSGFKLTERGALLYRHVVDLFGSIHQFQLQASELKGSLHGQLRIGFLDNVISDPGSPLRESIARFVRKRPNQVKLTLEVLGPRELERGLLDDSIDVAVGIFHTELPSLSYRPWYREREVLVCHRTHELASMTDPAQQACAIPRAAKVTRSFMGEREFPQPLLAEAPLVGSVVNVEAAAMLILSGEYIGFLPQHYARQWVDSGEMVELLPERFVRHSQLMLVTRAYASLTSAALAAFLQCTEPAAAVTPRAGAQAASR